jgi:hypothetical protein
MMVSRLAWGSKRVSVFGHATYLVHPILSDLKTVEVFVEEYKLQGSSLWKSIQPLGTSCRLGPNILLSIPYACACSFCRVTDQLSHLLQNIRILIIMVIKYGLSFILRTLSFILRFEVLTERNVK